MRLRGVLWARALAFAVGVFASGPSLAAAAGADGFGPVLWRNTSPVSATLGLPRTASAVLPAPGALAADLALDWASDFTTNQRGDALVRLDGESLAGTLRLERGLAPGWAASLTVPFGSRGGGVLDQPIDGWHNLWRLPEGGRDRAPTGAVSLFASEAGASAFAVDQRRSSLGDMQLGLARTLVDDGASVLTLRAQLELPTGSASELWGSDGWEGSLALALARPLGPLALTLQGGVLAGTAADFDPFERKDLAGFGSLALAWPLSPRWSLLGQLDGHSALLDTPLTPLGGWSVQGLLGLRWRSAGAFAMDFGFSEDLRPGSASDFSLFATLRYRP
ncbi:MAG: DUF3187 family protein [Pseudomonadales bacterium]